MSTRAAEYRMLIDEMLAEDAALRAMGLPGLEVDELAELRELVSRVMGNLQQTSDMAEPVW